MMKTLIIPILILFSTIEIIAQNISDEKLSVSKEYRTGAFQPTPILDKFDLNLNQTIDGYQVGRDSMISLSTPSTQMELSIDPLTYHQEEIVDGNTGHLKFTKGTINDLSVQGAIFHRVDNYFTIAAQGAYDSWNESMIHNKFQKAIKGSLLGNYYLTDKSQVTFSLATQSVNRGVFSELVTSELSDTTRVKSFESSMSYSTFHDEEDALNFGVGITFNTTKHENLTIKENLWTLSPYISKSFNSSLSVKLQSTNYLSSNVGMTAPYVSSSQLSFRVNRPRFTLRVGGTLNSRPDILSLYPMVTANLYLNSDNYVSGQVVEEIRYLGLNAVTQDNPYLNDSYVNPIISQVRQHRLAVSNRVTETVKVRAQLSYNVHRSDVNWIVSASDRHLFDINEVDYTAWSAQASVSINPYRFINLTVRAEKNMYEITSEDLFLFYRPEHKAEIEIGFKTEDGKFNIAMHNFFSDRQLIDVDLNNEVVTSDYRYDSNLDIRYRPFDMLSVELSANNLFNNQFEVLRGYDVFGRNFSASVLFKF